MSLSRPSRNLKTSKTTDLGSKASHASNTACGEGQDSDQADSRYSLRQYQELLVHIWRSQLDQENKREIHEEKFFKFLRENKIVTEKKQMDEMFK